MLMVRFLGHRRNTRFLRGLRGFHGNFKGRVKGFRVNGTKFIVAESDEKYI